LKAPRFNSKFRETAAAFLSAIVLIALFAMFFAALIVLIKYFLITLSGLYEPIALWVKYFIAEKKLKNELLFQAVIILKIFSLIITSGFIFVVYSAFSTVLSCFFYKFCGRNYRKIKHPIKYALMKGIKWSFYRAYIVISPPVAVVFVSTTLVVLSILMFNFLMKIAALSITLTVFATSFIFFSLIFLFMFSLVFSLWRMTSTIFGAEIAVSEPKLKNKIIARRSQKLIFANSYNVYLFLSYFLFVYFVSVQIKYAVTTDLLTNIANQEFVNQIIALNILCFCAFEYFKSSSYINCLIEHDKKLSQCPVKSLNIFPK
jgi:hypothetical protein